MIEAVSVWCDWCDREVFDGDPVRVIRHDGVCRDDKVYHAKCAEELVRAVISSKEMK